MTANMGVDFFINLPKSVAEAESEAWVLTERPPGPLPSLFMYCFPDRVVCALFDDTNYIAGLQISVSSLVLAEDRFSLLFADRIRSGVFKT